MNELLTLEFRYTDKQEDYKSEKYTIGIFDTLDAVVEAGNKLLDLLSKNFEVRPDDMFKVKHLFNCPKRLVTNTCYPTNGVQYFAKITPLTYCNTDEVVERLLS